MFGGGQSPSPAPAKRGEKKPVYKLPADIAPSAPVAPTTPNPLTQTPVTPTTPNPLTQTPVTPTTPTNPLFNNPEARVPRRRRIYPGSASGVLFSGLGPGLY